MKAFLFSAGRIIIIHFLMLLAPAIADIFFLGFRTFTVACFAVAGVFSALFCYSAWLGKVTSGKNEKTVLYTILAVLSVCALLFFLVAPLSGSEYNLPVKLFAVTEALTMAFFWKTKFHNHDHGKATGNVLICSAVARLFVLQ